MGGKSRGGGSRNQRFNKKSGGDDLEINFNGFLDHLPDAEEEDSSASSGDSDDDDELDPSQVKFGQKVLSKNETFPGYGKMRCLFASSDEEEEEEEEEEQEEEEEVNKDGRQTASPSMVSEGPIQRSISLPLVSAMKGSREKQGLQPIKLAVQWAPEVYDPPPTNINSCRTKGTKKAKCRKGKGNNNDDDDTFDSKKAGKKGQKGNFSRGKEKKQQQRNAARNDKSRRSSFGDDGY